MVSKPYLIIVAGPTASGKATLPSKVIKHAKLNSRGVKSFLIDDLVEQNPYFKQKVGDYINRKGKTYADIKSMFLNPTEAMLNELNNYYFIARDSTNCNSGGKCVNKNDCNTCALKLDIGMKKAFDKGANMVFETKGSYWPDWVFNMYKDQIKRHKYTVIVSWSIVELCELLIRNKTRAIKSLDAFLLDPTSSPPRLPDIRIGPYTMDLLKIINVFKKHNSSKKLCTSKTAKCIRLLLFDNNTTESKLLYDSSVSPNEIGNIAIDKYLLGNPDFFALINRRNNAKKVVKPKEKLLRKRSIKLTKKKDINI